MKESYVGVPTLAGVFVLGMLLLFFRDLDTALRLRLVPAVVVYVLGVSLLAFFYWDLDARNCVTSAKKGEKMPGPQPLWIFGLFIAAHMVWFLLFVIYLLWKAVL